MVCLGGAAAGAAAMVAVVLWSEIEFLVPEWYDWIFWAGVGVQPGALPAGILAWACGVGKGGSCLECFDMSSPNDDGNDEVLVEETQMTAADDVV